MAILLDLLILLILGFCIWNGSRKGLFLSVAGIVIVLLSSVIAGRIAGACAEQVSQSIYPIMRFVAEDAIDDATKGKGHLGEITDGDILEEIARETYSKLGIHPKEADKLVEKAENARQRAETKIQDAIAQPVLYSFSYMILCVFAFLFSMVGLTLLMHLISTIFKLPVVRSLDKAGGLIAGAIYGILIVSAIGWAARFLGIAGISVVLDKTFLLKAFVNVNPLSWVLGF
ncbi:MAG: CvpA family protein [Oscillospiraceae bacterium]|nr:CvpA family protein [Oscillospiraceae bacterium]